MKFCFHFQTTNVALFGTSWTDPSYAEEHPECIDCDIKPPSDACKGPAKQKANDECEAMYSKDNAPLKVT